VLFLARAFVTSIISNLITFVAQENN
jgi:hypothetical protein